MAHAEVTKEDIRTLVLSPHISLEVAKETIRTEFEIEVDEDTINPEELVELIWNSYIESKLARDKKMSEIKTYRSKPVNKPKALSKPTRKKSQKDIIIDLIGEGSYNQRDLIVIMNKKFDLEAKGKTSRARVVRVIRDLRRADKLIINVDKTLALKEEV